MAPVFGHGRLRLYLLALLAEAPRHGYEVIRQLEERFQGLYAPSAGTVYPRLAKLEQEGLVTHTEDGGRKVYAITDAGRAELADRQTELAELELDINVSVAELAADIREDVTLTAESLREEMLRAAGETKNRRKPHETPVGGPGSGPHTGSSGSSGSGSGEAPWDNPDFPFLGSGAKREWAKARKEAKEQARRAREESRKAQEEVRRAREQTRWVKQQAAEEMRRIKQQMQESARRGDFSELAETLASLGRNLGWPLGTETESEEKSGGRQSEGKQSGTKSGRQKPPKDAPHETPVGDWDFNFDFGSMDADEGSNLPQWAMPTAGEDPVRAVSGILDRFRDEVRDTARDEGASEEQSVRLGRLLAHAAKHWRDES